MFAPACRQEEVITSYRAILEGILNQSSEQTAAGLSFHLVDVFVPELLSVLREERKQISDAALQQMLQMFIGGIATSSRASLPPRVRYKRTPKHLLGVLRAEMGD